jgi:predicted flap endonuclease-1-like 5' DNA nuclease
MRANARSYLAELRARRLDPNGTKAAEEATRPGRITATRKLAGNQRKPASTVTARPAGKVAERAPRMTFVECKYTEVKATVESSKRNAALSRLEHISGKPAAQAAQPLLPKPSRRRVPSVAAATPEERASDAAVQKLQQNARKPSRRTKMRIAPLTNTRAQPAASRDRSPSADVGKPVMNNHGADISPRHIVSCFNDTTALREARGSNTAMARISANGGSNPASDAELSDWLAVRADARDSARTLRAQQTATRLAERAEAAQQRISDAAERRARRAEERVELREKASSIRGKRLQASPGVFEARMERRERQIAALKEAAAAKAAAEAAQAERKAREAEEAIKAEEARKAAEARKAEAAEKRAAAAAKAKAEREAKEQAAEAVARKKEAAAAKRKATLEARKRAEVEAQEKARQEAEALRLADEKARKKAAALAKRNATIAAKKNAEAMAQAEAEAKAKESAEKKLAAKAARKQKAAARKAGDAQKLTTPDNKPSSQEPAEQAPVSDPVEAVDPQPVHDGEQRELQSASIEAIGAVEHPTAKSAHSELDLSALPNIGPAMRSRLGQLGIFSVNDLAGMSAAGLRQKLGAISHLANVEQWISDAEMLVEQQQRIAA